MIGKAVRWRKMLGGGMRQAGVLASAGILAMTEQVQHLQKDHENARILANTLVDLPGLDIDQNAVQTNMVVAGVKEGTRPSLVEKMAKEGVLLHGFGDEVRLVTHFDFSEDQIEPVAAAFSRVLATS
jgi:threonine aldolase